MADGADENLITAISQRARCLLKTVNIAPFAVLRRNYLEKHSRNAIKNDSFKNMKLAFSTVFRSIKRTASSGVCHSMDIVSVNSSSV